MKGDFVAIVIDDRPSDSACSLYGEAITYSLYNSRRWRREKGDKIIFVVANCSTGTCVYTDSTIAGKSHQF
jgi:hypothetical protein